MNLKNLKIDIKNQFYERLSIDGGIDNLIDWYSFVVRSWNCFQFFFFL